jgi:hypothetical protein
MAKAQGDQRETHFISVESSRLDASLKGGCFRCGVTPVQTTLLYTDVNDGVEEVRSFCKPCLEHLLGTPTKVRTLHSVKP